MTQNITDMPSPYFFFHPILANDRRWVALNWQPGTPLAGQSSKLVRCFTESAAAPLADQLPLVLPVTLDDLEQDAFVDGFKPRQVVFVVPSDSVQNARALVRCKQLHGQGYRLGVQVDHVDLLRKIPVSSFGFLRFDAEFARQSVSAADMKYTRDAGFSKIATQVDSLEMYNWLTEKEFDWCDSHFLVARNPNGAGKAPDLARFKLLKLLTLVKQDGDTREIEEIFRQEPKLSYNLLRLVNSVAVGARTKISSFSQAIAILGRRQLQRWLQLLIYANNLAEGHAPNPLMQLAAARGRQMEMLAASIEPRPAIADLYDNAFMVGLFSLLDVLIDLPMVNILKELPMQDEVVQALTPPEHSGILGQLLSSILAGESGQFSAAEKILQGLGIEPRAHAAAQVSAFYWASRINIGNPE